MTFIEQISLIERMDQLIRLKSTGNPEEFARKLGYSERQVFRLVNTMKAKGFPIAYCKRRHTYYYEKEVIFRFEVYVVEEKDTVTIRGGNNFWDFDDFFFQTDKLWQGQGFSL